MSLAGSRVGAYEIATLIGAGGMGEVYRARDTKLGREVAIKILPPAFANDPERLARFEREARLLASLNHPHIAQIYGLEESAGVTALVLELVEGQPLDRKLRGGALPVDEALTLARQIAEALDATHERGIVHRDLKPGNIIVTHDGAVKVLDFGLAKAAGEAGGAGRAGGSSGWDDGMTHSPTALPATLSGVLLGTAPYMSPEQARGKAVDKRTDIWAAFGCVLYEMLSGRRAFAGETATDTVAAILEREPDWTKLPERTPAHVRELLHRCFEKDPKRRLRDIGDARAALETRPATRGEAARKRYTPVVPLLVIAIAALAGGWLMLARRPAARAVTAAPSLTPVTSDPGYEGEPTFAPDGETIAYVSDRSGDLEIYLKQASGGRDINLTNDSADDIQPAFSPDGRQIAFVSSRGGASPILPFGTDNPLMGGDIWVMPALGGSARRVAANGNFPSWTPDGARILFISGPWFGKKLYTVSAAGGTPEEIPLKQPPVNLLLSSSFSPNGRWILFEAMIQGASTVLAVARSGGDPRIIVRGRQPMWAADGASVVYTNDAAGSNYSLWEIPFSPESGTVAGPPRALTVGAGRDLATSASRDGTRIAFTKQSRSSNLELLPFDAEAGRELGPPTQLTSGMQSINFWSFSPDSKSIAFDAQRGGGSSLWRVGHDGAPVALTGDDRYVDTTPRWSPDGSSILFTRATANNPAVQSALWIMTADGAGPRLLVEGAQSPATQWTPDGKGAVYFRSGQLYAFDIASGRSRPLTDETRVMPVTAISPDGRWVVFQSTASGTVDLRAVPWEGGPTRTVVATAGQDYHPFFSPTGRWLYFELDHKNMYRVPGPALDWKPEPPQKTTHFPESGLSLEDPKVSPDGRQLGFSRVRTTGDVWLLTRSR